MWRISSSLGFVFVLKLSLAQIVTVSPYIQPGNAPGLNREQKVIIWHTDGTKGNYTVECKLGGSFDSEEKPLAAKVSSTELNLNNVPSILYRATLSGLKFDETYTYRVSLDDKVIAESTFETRTKSSKTKFAVFGDCGASTPQQAQIAYQVYQQKPQFALLVGDMVYSYGQESEYRRRFFPYYNSADALPDKGAPLMKSIPFYMLLGNHDIYSADFSKFPDGLAYFYYSDLPLNAPITASTVVPEGNPDLAKAFRKNTTPRYPRMANYSFDYGNVHIVCLDANYYVNPLDPALVDWLTNDLRSSKADWKIVAYHQPAFNTSQKHYDYQIMRLLSPRLETLGVDLVLTGHVHNYQRTVPLKFAPKKDEVRNTYVISPEGRVDGTFTLDTNFNGQTNLMPDGIIYIVTGAGGAVLYDPELNEKPDLWQQSGQENWAPFAVKLVSDIHSFTMIETDGKTLTLRQLDVHGNAFDEITISK